MQTPQELKALGYEEFQTIKYLNETEVPEKIYVSFGSIAKTKDTKNIPNYKNDHYSIWTFGEFIPLDNPQTLKNIRKKAKIEFDNDFIQQVNLLNGLT